MRPRRPRDVDVCEFYDPFSFEIIRQFEAFGFCKEGEGGDFVMDGRIGSAASSRRDQRRADLVQPRGHRAAAAEGDRSSVLQLRGALPARAHGARRAVAMTSNGGAGALFCDVLLLGKERP